MLLSRRGPAVRWLRRAGSLLYRVIYGKDPYVETWTFPPRSLSIAREALGLNALQAYELAGRPFGSGGDGWGHVLHWSDLETSKKPIRCTQVKLAVLISTGMAVHARAAGSARALAELIMFGPAPLSHYPPITPVRHGDLDSQDLRRMMDAYNVLCTAQRQLKYHDTTAALDRRLAESVAELERWFDS